MFSQIIIVLLLVLVVDIASIHSLPIKKERRSVPTTDSPSARVTISRSVLNMLIDLELDVQNDHNASKGLLPLFLSADFLSKDPLFISEVP